MSVSINRRRKDCAIRAEQMMLGGGELETEKAGRASGRERRETGLVEHGER